MTSPTFFTGPNGGLKTELSGPIADVASGQEIAVQPVGYDAMTRVQNTMGYEHHEIHDGNHFMVCDYDADLDTAEEIRFLMTTPDTIKWTHLTFEVSGTTQTIFSIYEGSSFDTSSAGTAFLPFNNNRNSANASVNSLWSGSVVTNTGTLIYRQSRGKEGTTPARAAAAGFGTREREIILKQNETYLFLIQTGGDDNIVSYCGEWYEHTNKN